MPHQSGAPFASVRSFPKEQWYRAGVFFVSPPPPPFPFFALAPIFHCHKIKDAGYENITNTNKVSPTQNMPALQAIPLPVTLFYLPCLSFTCTVILRNIVGKNACSNPERYFGWFLVHCSSKQVWKDGIRGHGCMFTSAKGIKQQKYCCRCDKYTLYLNT